MALIRIEAKAQVAEVEAQAARAIAQVKADVRDIVAQLATISQAPGRAAEAATGDGNTDLYDETSMAQVLKFGAGLGKVLDTVKGQLAYLLFGSDGRAEDTSEAGDNARAFVAGLEVTIPKAG